MTGMSAPIPHRGPLFVLDRYDGPQAGTERQILELATGLIERGFRPGFLLLQRSAWLEDRFQDLPFFTIGSSRLRSLKFWKRAREGAAWAHAEGFRVAHIFLNDAALVFPGLLRAQGIRVVQARRDLGFWYTALKLRVLRLNRRWTSAVVANSQAVADVVAGAEGYDRARLLVIYNGVRQPQSAAADRAVLRESLGVGPADRLVVMVANLRPLKRPEDAVRAVAAIDPDSGRAVHLALVGGDPAPAGTQTRALRMLAEELGAANRIHCVGQVPSAAPWVAAADVCVLCSETEGLSNAVIEYMLGGKPVVCTAVGGNTELISEGETGFLVSVGDVAAITERVLRVLDNAAEGARLGAAAQSRALMEFSVEGMVGRHVALYERLAAA